MPNGSKLIQGYTRITMSHGMSFGIAYMTILPLETSMEEWVTIQEAVDRLGMSERTLRRHIANKKIKSCLDNGRRLVCVTEDDNEVSDDMSVDMQQILDEKDSRIEQLVKQNEQLEIQVDRLTQLLAMAHKSIQQLTDQNQLLLEDHRQKLSWWRKMLPNNWGKKQQESA